MYWRRIGESFIFCMIMFKIKNIRSWEISVSQDKSQVDIKKVNWNWFPHDCRFLLNISFYKFPQFVKVARVVNMKLGFTD